MSLIRIPSPYPPLAGLAGMCCKTHAKVLHFWAAFRKTSSRQRVTAFSHDPINHTVLFGALGVPSGPAAILIRIFRCRHKPPCSD